MQIQKIDTLDYVTLHNILTSNKISEVQKTQFIKNNKSQIKSIVEDNFHVSEAAFKCLMQHRSLVKFKPIKNSFTKVGDKIILSKALNISPSEVASYIKKVTEDLKKVNDLSFLDKGVLDTVKTYVYRHGSKDELVTFLDYELKTTNDILKTLYTTLEYHSGGLADYFIRPIHRMDNKTLIKIYNVINDNLKTSRDNGFVNEEINDKIAKWALYRIYQIQNNSKFINAVKTYKTLSGS